MPLPEPDALLAATRTAHEAIRAEVGEVLRRAHEAQRPELASRPGAWGAGDLGYAIDDAAEPVLASLANDLARWGDVTLVAEGPGTQVFPASQAGEGAADAPLRVLVDPIDGTRGLMLDLRPAWVLTGIAPDRGEPTRLADIEVAVQTELPTTTAAVYHVLTAVRGRGATWARHDVASGDCLESRPLRARDDVPLDNGLFSFMRYLPDERPIVARLESAFLAHLLGHQAVDPHLLYEDQWLCTAGQLFLTVTGRYRMLADLRGWIGREHGLATFTSKPYDLASLLVFEEAGLPVLDAALRPLDAPLDTSTPLDVVAFASAAVRAAYEPSLRVAMGAAGGPAA